MRYTAYQMATPANAITLVGLLLTLAGCLFLDTWAGLLLVVFGRLLDLIDGPVARATRKTEFSVFFDPTADKLALAAILVSVSLYNLVPLAVVAYVLLQNLAVVTLSLKANKHRKAVGAIIPGKLNMFFQQSAIVWFIAASLIPNELHIFPLILAWINFALSIPFALFATRGYAKLLQ